MKNRTILEPGITRALSVIRPLLLAALILSAVWSPGLGQELPEFGVVPLSGPDGMLLVIGGPPLHPSSAASNGGWGGYNIYRKAEGDSAFVRITGTPLSRPGSLSDLERAMGGALDGFERYAGLSSKQELWQSIERNDTSIIAIAFLSKNFRRALGLLTTDADVRPGVTYQYQATLVAANGEESKPSEAQQAVFGVPLIPLPGPLDLSARSTPGGVVLTWKPNPADSGLFSYSVYRCPDPAGTFLKLNLAALTPTFDSTVIEGEGTFTDTTARTGRTYYYAVVSTDYAGNESPRTHLLPVLPTIQLPPTIPQNVFANPSDLGIAITWDTVRGTDVAGYNIYRSTDADSNFVRLNSGILPLAAGYYEDQGTTLSDRYFYRVTAVNSSGLESEKSALALSLYENRRRPLPPQGVSAKSRSDGISVAWEAGNGPEVRGYYVYRADSYNGSLSQISPLLGRDTTEFVDSSAYIAASGQYWYLVQTVNFSGLASAYSAPAASSPDKPKSVDAPLSFFGYADGGTVRLFWTKSDNNSLAGYNLYRSPDSSSLNWELLTDIPLPRDLGEYTDSTAAPGAACVYRIRAVNDRGIEGAPSHDLRVMISVPAPLPPAGIRVAQEGDALKISWTGTRQPGVAGYRVYRRTDTEAGEALTKELIPTSGTEYRDSSVRAGTRYYYSISSVDQSGREGDHSPEVPYLCE